MQEPFAVDTTPAATPRGFALKFVLGFAILTGSFEASRGTGFERFVVEDLILIPTTAVINRLAPGEHVELVGRTIAAAGGRLHVTRGCEGVEMFLLLVAGVMAYPATWKCRAQGVLLGSVLAYALTVGRLVTLHYVLRYSPNAWAALHGLILPLAPIVLLAFFFLRWSACGCAPGCVAQVPHAP